MCLELQNKKLLFWKRGQGRNALDGFSHLAYAGVRESVRSLISCKTRNIPYRMTLFIWNMN